MPLNVYRAVFNSATALKQFMALETGFLFHFNGVKDPTSENHKFTRLDMTPQYADGMLRKMYETPGLPQAFLDSRMVTDERTGQQQDKVRCLFRTMSPRHIDDKTSPDHGLKTFSRLLNMFEGPLRKLNDPAYNDGLRSSLESEHCKTLFNEKFPSAVKHKVKPS
jgi:hypothetical protein